MKQQQQKRERYKRTVIAGGGLLLAFVMVMASLLFFSRRLAREEMENSREQLEIISEQGTSIVNSHISESIDMLESVAEVLVHSGSYEEEEIRLILSHMLSRGSMRYMGLVGADGKGILSSGEQVDISGEDYFQKAMKGVSCISELIFEKEGIQRVIVTAVPVFLDQDVLGVIYGMQDVDAYSKILCAMEVTESRYSHIFDSAGNMVIKSSHQNSIFQYGNVYETLEGAVFDEGYSLEQFQETVAKGETGFLGYNKGRARRFAYYMPLGINDWYILSIMPKDVIFENMASVQQLVMEFTGGILVAFVCVLFVVVYLAAKINRALMDSNEEYLSQQKILKYRAEIDAMTGVYNRAAITQLVEDFLGSREGKEGLHAFFILDLDNFKLLNDRLGHAKGDEALMDVTRKLRENLRRTDLIGRLGGDEFVLLLREVYEMENLERLAQKITDLLRETYEVDGVSVEITASLGAACIQGRGETFEELYHRADLALYQVKQKQKNAFAVFETLKGL